MRHGWTRYWRSTMTTTWTMAAAATPMCACVQRVGCGHHPSSSLQFSCSWQASVRELEMELSALRAMRGDREAQERELSQLRQQHTELLQMREQLVSETASLQHRKHLHAVTG